MRLRNLVQDDDAVSPVIGVILMVAITVILAAVIASFVLGLGNQAGGVAPQANFEFNYQPDNNTAAGGNADGTLVVTHVSGDSIRADTLYVRGQKLASMTNQPDLSDDPANQWEGQQRGSIEGVSAVQSGDQAYIELINGGSGTTNDYVARIIWEDPDGDTTSQLAEDRGPDAS